MTDLTDHTWRPVGPDHPQAAELVPDDVVPHTPGPSCWCSPAVSLADQCTNPTAVTETWIHRRSRG